MDGRTLLFTVEKAFDQTTVEKFLLANGISRRALIKLKQSPNDIRKNGVHARSIDRVRTGDQICLYIAPKATHLRQSEKSVPILYEDADILVFDKPAQMPCHPSGMHINDTLANVWAAHCAKRGQTVSPLRALNRLDKDTSGAVVVAKHQIAAARLKGCIQKEYFALVQGVLSPQTGTIDIPIERERPFELKRITSPDGQRAVTEYQTLASDGQISLVRCVLRTGRTHQIRVHFAHLGHPLLGDALYGGNTNELSRQGLHCAKVAFLHPISRAPLAVYAPFAQDLQTVLQKHGLPILQGEQVF